MIALSENQSKAKGLMYDRKLEYVRVVKEMREYIRTNVDGYLQTRIAGLLKLEILQRTFLVKCFGKDFLRGSLIFVTNNCISFTDGQSQTDVNYIQMKRRVLVVYE